MSHYNHHVVYGENQVWYLGWSQNLLGGKWADMHLFPEPKLYTQCYVSFPQNYFCWLYTSQISSYPAHQLAHRSQLFNCVSPNSEFGPMETKSNCKLYSIQLIYIKTSGLKDLSAYVQYLALAVIIFKLRYDSICVSSSKIR